MKMQWIKGAGGVLVALAPLAVPHWVSATSEGYGAEPYVESHVNLTTNARGTFDAVAKTCATGENGASENQGNQDFQRDCDTLLDPNVGSEQEKIQAFNQLAADQIAAKNAGARRQFRANIAGIGSRLSQVRLSAAAPNLDEAIAWNLQKEKGGGASGDLTAGKLGGFFNLKYRTGDQDASDREAGFDFDGWGLTAGADYRVNENFVAGVSLNYMEDKADYEQNRGDMKTETWGLTAYGTFFTEGNFFVDGLIGYNSSDYKLKRNINYNIGGNAVSQVASSDTDGKMFQFSVGGGYNMNQGGFTITPTARLDYLRNKVDGYTESMSNPGANGSAMAMNVDSVTYKSLTTRLGGQVSKAISHSGGVVIPQLSVSWVHEFEDDAKEVGARFINDINQTPFLVLTENGDTDYFDLGVAISGQFAGGKSAFLSYNTLLGFNRVTYHGINAGIRMEF